MTCPVGPVQLLRTLAINDSAPRSAIVHTAIVEETTSAEFWQGENDEYQWRKVDCVREEDVPGDLDRAVVTNRVTSDAYAAELVAHSRMHEGFRTAGESLAA
jgi:hypothetical protein